MILSKRLMRIAECIEGADCVADIGTDHAYLPIALIRQGRAKHVIAMDVREKPLLRAKKNIEEAGMGEQITLRLSDGAEKLLPGEASMINISGMGGSLMGRIIAERPEVFQAAQALYLSPQSELSAFRRQLMELGYHIVDEWMVSEDGKYYFILQAEAGRECADYEPCELLFGRHLLNRQDQTLYAFLKHEKHIQETVLHKLMQLETKNAAIRRKEIMDDLEVIDTALLHYNLTGGGLQRIKES